jgi:hypothetical protein
MSREEKIYYRGIDILNKAREEYSHAYMDLSKVYPYILPHMCTFIPSSLPESMVSISESRKFFGGSSLNIFLRTFVSQEICYVYSTTFYYSGDTGSFSWSWANHHWVERVDYQSNSKYLLGNQEYHSCEVDPSIINSEVDVISQKLAVREFISKAPLLDSYSVERIMSGNVSFCPISFLAFDPIEWCYIRDKLNAV